LKTKEINEGAFSLLGQQGAQGFSEIIAGKKFPVWLGIMMDE